MTLGTQVPQSVQVESDVDATTEKLQRKFGEGHGPLPDEEIAAVVRDEAEELEDAPVQAFTSLIAEKQRKEPLAGARGRSRSWTLIFRQELPIGATGTHLSD